MLRAVATYRQLRLDCSAIRILFLVDLQYMQDTFLNVANSKGETMGCEEKAQLFNEMLAKIQSDFKGEMQALASETQKQTSELDKQFEGGNDLAEGIGAAAGTAIGGAFAGAPGAAAGAIVGKTIGSLFEIEITEQGISVDVPIPEFGVENQDWIITIPQVEMKDEDIIFNLPTLVMQRIEGPPKPETVVKMVTQCHGPSWARICFDVPETTITWTPTYLDVPTYEDREHRIVLGVPQVTMVDEKVVVGMPTVKISNQVLSMTVPSVTIRYVADTSKEIADAANAIAADATAKTELKKQALASRMRAELLGPAQEMFLCHRDNLMAQRANVDAQLSTQVETATNALIALKAAGVPEADDDYAKAKANADALVEQRAKSLAHFDDAIAELDLSSKEAIGKMMAV